MEHQLKETPGNTGEVKVIGEISEVIQGQGKKRKIYESMWIMQPKTVLFFNWIMSSFFLYQ